jgi:predicted dehydrogenase
MSGVAKPLRVAVIGLGIGEQHVLSYQAIPGIEVVAVCDIDPVRLAEIGGRRGIARRHADWRAITTGDDIDVVSVCSYDCDHARQAVSAFRHGKHVFIEKPIALNRAESARILRAQQDSGRLISSNLILRASPRFTALKQWIDAGEMGDVFYMEGDYIHQILRKITEGWRGRMPFYNVTYGGGIHLIDLMRWLVGREVVEVAAMGNKILTQGSAYAFPDTMVSLLRFEGDIMAKTTTTFGPQRTKFHALNVYGTRKTFINDMPSGRLFDGDQPENEHEVTIPYPGMAKGDLIPDFISAIREGRQPRVSATDVFRVMDVCCACWEALRKRRTIRVSYLI